MDIVDMKGFKSPDFADRQATADAARKAAVAATNATKTRNW